MLAAATAQPARAQQGVAGVVLLLEGNQAPAPGQPQPAPRPARRVVAVYQLTHQNQATAQNGFFHTIATKKVAQGRSAKSGRFRIKLPPGNYSLFVREKNGLYANQWDANGFIHPVTVAPRVFTQTTLLVSHQATF